MRVESLQIHDFKSYQDAELELSGVQLASVVGPNGAGKSSILEAIAFALTGARSLRNLDQFIRQGCEECRVALTFSTGGETYRLTRTRSSRGSGKSTLELARQDDSGLWAAEGTGARDTEERVRQILGCDEDTLLQTAIVSQGDAGSFFALRPAQRLEALGSILRLDEQYSPIEKHFKAQADSAKTSLEAARRDVERLEVEVGRLAEKEETLLFAEGERVTYVKRVWKYERELVAANAALALARENAAGVDRAAADLEQLTERKRELQDRLRILALEREQLEDRTAERAELERALDGRSFLEDALAGAQLAREADQATAAERRRLEEAIGSAREALNGATEEYRQAVAREKQAREALARDEHTRDQAHAQVDALDVRIAEIASAEQPICDRCGQTVDAEALERTLASLKRECEAAVEKRNHAVNVINEQALPRVHEAEAQVTTAGALGQARRSSLDFREAELAALPASMYSENDHRRLEEELEALQEIPAKLAAIAALEERLTAVRRDAENAATALEDPALADALTKAREAASAAQGATGALRAAEHAVQGAEATLTSAREAHAEADRAVARLEGEIAQLAPSREALAEAGSEAKRLEQEQADAELLRKAFSKWGVPALIVGNVLLALEKEVNELLALYEGSLALRFESTKDTKTGARDSLEIIVYDGEDWRPFETFSGGERYRVASAMRLGLAQLLSHRSGARVSTLIVDEPEGLDAPGRAHLARILERMSESFGITLLLTHYDDLKDAMPQQIVVSRGEDGLSRVEVVA
jgi:exonuclease SbcC